MRVGDRLPSFTAQVVNEFEQPINITGSRAYLVLAATNSASVFGQPSPYVVECSIVAAETGSLRYDWTQAQVDALTPGVINVTVRFTASDGFSAVFLDSFDFDVGFEVGARNDASIVVRPFVEGGRAYLLNDTATALLLNEITGQPMLAP